MTMLTTATEGGAPHLCTAMIPSAHDIRLAAEFTPDAERTGQDDRRYRRSEP